MSLFKNSRESQFGTRKVMESNGEPQASGENTGEGLALIGEGGSWGGLVGWFFIGCWVSWVRRQGSVRCGE